MKDPTWQTCREVTTAEWPVAPWRFVIGERDDRTETGEDELFSLSKSRGLIPYASTTEKEHRADSLVGYRRFRPGDIVMNKLQAWNGVFGLSRESSGIVSPDYVVLTVSPDGDPRYYEYLLKTDLYAGMLEVRSTGVGTGFLRLQRENRDSTPLPRPDPPIQRKIADFLDRETGRIDALTDKKRRLIDLLEEKRTATITHAVTKGLDPTAPMKDSGIPWIGEIPLSWSVAPIRRATTFMNSNVDKKIVDGETPVLLCNYTDVYYGTYLDSTDGFMPGSATADEIRRFRLKKDIVIITKDSESADDIGVPAYVAAQLDAVCGYHLTILDPVGSLITGEFLYWVLESTSLRQAFETHAQGVTRFGLTRDGIGSPVIPLPGIPEQRAIVNRLRALDRHVRELTRRIETQLSLLAEYREALITAAVTGGIDVDTFDGGQATERTAS